MSDSRNKNDVISPTIGAAVGSVAGTASVYPSFYYYKNLGTIGTSDTYSKLLSNILRDSKGRVFVLGSGAPLGPAREIIDKHLSDYFSARFPFPALAKGSFLPSIRVNTRHRDILNKIIRRKYFLFSNVRSADVLAHEYGHYLSRGLAPLWTAGNVIRPLLVPVAAASIIGSLVPGVSDDKKRTLFNISAGVSGAALAAGTIPEIVANFLGNRWAERTAGIKIPFFRSRQFPGFLSYALPSAGIMFGSLWAANRYKKD